MKLHNTLSILITSLLLCGNAFAKPSEPEPFQEQTNSSGSAQEKLSAFNPGKRLEVEYVSLQILIATGEVVGCDVTAVEDNIVLFHHDLIVVFSGAWPQGDIHIASTPMTMFVPHGGEIWFTCSVTFGGVKVMHVAASGHWYDE